MMSLILQVFGVLFIVVSVVGGYVLYRLYRFWQRVRREMQDPSGLDTPSRVTLIEANQPDWAEAEGLKHTLSELRSLGFQHAGNYDALEMPHLHVVGLVHPEDYLFATVYSISQGKLWTDLCSEQIDGEVLTISNADTGGMLDHAPGRRQLVNSEWRIPDLYDGIKAERRSGPFKDTFAADFKAAFEHAYAVEMDWRNSRGGAPTWDEFVRIAKQAGRKLTNEKLEDAYYDAVYEKGVLRLSDECVATFCIETTLSVPEWEAVRDTCFALHEHIPNSHLADFIADHFCGLDEDRLKQLNQVMNPALSAVANFEQFNEMLPEHLQAIKLGDVTDPVPAEVFAAPLRPDSLDVSA